MSDRVANADDIAETATIAARAGVLDLLAVAVREITYEFDGADYAEKPAVDYQATYQVVGRHFPTLAYYNVPDSITSQIAESKMSVGDAIDDIVDILLDLKGVIWRFENTSADEALWDFSESFKYHWGRHLRELQLYLHVLASALEADSSTKLENP